MSNSKVRAQRRSDKRKPSRPGYVSRQQSLERLEERRLLTSQYLQFALVSDQSAALLQDANLVNPWGIGLNQFSGNFWIADNGKGVVSQYGGDVNSQPLAKSPLAVSVPNGSPTASVANASGAGFTVSSGGFSGSSAFLFANKSGQISGWNANVPPPNPSISAQVGASATGAVFTGMTMATSGGQPLLFATDFHHGTVDVFNSSFQQVTLSGSFTDPNLPAGLSPYNIQSFFGNLYVAYAVPDASGQNAVAGSGNGRIDVFDSNGNLISTVVPGNPGGGAPALNAPWGLAVAPNNFGNLSNALLVANSGSGVISAFDPFSGSFAGTVSDTNGNPITISGLHGLSFGNGSSAGVTGVLFFTAGPNNQTHGLFGSMESADGMPIDSVGGSFSATTGALYNGVVATFAGATLSAPASSYRATIAWGDGTSSNGVLTPLGGGRFNVGGSHTYSTTGTFNVTVTIADAQQNTTTAHSIIQASGGVLSLSAPSFAATEGAAFTGTVAAFTDGDGNTAPGLYTTTIAWGDGSTTAGTVSFNGVRFNISGSHTYAEEGAFNVVVNLHDTDGASASSSASVSVADAPLTILGGNLNLTEGAQFSGAVATFTDADPNGALSDYTATIRWGDGTTTSGTISAISGGFQIAGQHAYADEGNLTAFVIVNDAGGASATATIAASIAEGDFLTGGLAPITPTEGTTFSGVVANINNTNANGSASDFTATIDWGDGTITSGTISGSGGVLAISGSHVYSDEGTFVLTVTMVDDPPGTAAITLSGNIAVAEGDTLTPLPANLTTTEGHTFSGSVASFSDTNPAAKPGDFTATIDWGDGTVTSGTVTSSGSNLVVSGSHFYAEEGNLTGHVLLSDDPPGTAVATANVGILVADAPLTTTGKNLSLTEGVTFSGAVATLTDANPFATAADYTVTLNWGDGATTAGSVVANGLGGFNVLGQHAYAEGGSYLIGVFVHDIGGANSSVITSAAVADWPITGSPVAIAGTEGTPFTGAVATFFDSDPDGGDPSEYTVTINWGDGATTSGTVTGAAGSYTVSGSHAFADEASGVFVTIHDAGGSSATVNSPATIADADVLAGTGLTANATEGQTFSGALATFTDTYTANPASDFTVTIDWGDGATTGGTVTGSSGNFTVSGSHAYAEEGSHSPKVVLADDAPGTASATATATVNVADAPLTPHPLTFHPTENSTFNGLVGSFTDGNPSAPVSDFTATIDWGDGTTTSGTVVAAAGGFNVTGSHVFGEEGASQAVHIVVQDVGGSNTTIQSTAVVVDAPLAVTAVSVNGMEAATLNVAVATFTDPGGAEPVGNYSATINWGDGSASTGTISVSGGTFTVTGSHVYGDEGSFAVSVSVSEVGGGSGSAQGAAAILEELLSTGNRGTPTERWVNEVFHDLLGRQAEPGALTFWGGQAAAGGNRQQIVAQIINSNEYRLDQTEALYQHYLHRAADPSAQTFGVAFLQSGKTVEQLADVLIGSPEYFQVRGANTNDGFLDALFADTLNRPVDAGARTYFDGLLSSGTSTAKVGAILLSSTEYLDEVVQGIYLQLIERPTDPSGLAFWVNQLQHGARDEQITSGVAASDEYFNKTAP